MWLTFSRSMRTVNKPVRAVIIGGGTGTFTVLSSLKHHVDNITAIVNMVDDGGSTGVLRDELGVLPPGDIRQCLVALSPDSNVMRHLLNYRFESGTFKGHPFGNLLLSVLEKTSGDFTQAVRMAGQILSIKGQVVPVTTTDTRLCRRLSNGRVIKSQRIIEDSFFAPGEDTEVFLDPPARLNPEAAVAIKQADLVIFGPGNFYSSLVPILLVEGVAEAIAQAKGARVYICNLVNKPHQTAGYKVHDFVTKLEKYGQPGMFQYVVYDQTRPGAELLSRYLQVGERWVEFDEKTLRKLPHKTIGGDLLSEAPPPKPPNQPGQTAVSRNFIRHDSAKLARLLVKNFLQKQIRPNAKSLPAPAASPAETAAGKAATRSPATGADRGEV